MRDFVIEKKKSENLKNLWIKLFLIILMRFIFLWSKMYVNSGNNKMPWATRHKHYPNGPNISINAPIEWPNNARSPGHKQIEINSEQNIARKLHIERIHETENSSLEAFLRKSILLNCKSSLRRSKYKENEDENENENQ